MERRSFHRYPIQLDVKLKKPDGTTSVIDGKVVDVSSSGLGIIVSEKLQPGAEITIEWQNPPFYCDGEALAIGAIVNIVKPEEGSDQFKLGIEFSASDSELTQSLLNWIQMQASMKKRAESVRKQFTSQKRRIKF